MNSEDQAWDELHAVRRELATTLQRLNRARFWARSWKKKARQFQRLANWLDAFEKETRALPIQHEDAEKGQCSFNWRMAFIREARAAMLGGNNGSESEGQGCDEIGAGEGPGEFEAQAGQESRTGEPLIQGRTEEGEIPGYIWQTRRQDGAIIAVQKTITGGGRLILGNDSQVFEAWDYEDHRFAIAAAYAWEGMKLPEPEGWVRHFPSARRRPGGDASKEYVRP